MLASEVIKTLQKLVERYGDLEVYGNSPDYPDRIKNVIRTSEGDSYVPKGVFQIY